MVDAEFKMEHQRSMKDAAERLRDLDNTVGTQLEDAAEEIGLRVMATAARLVNVDTGRLRASLDSTVEDIGRQAVKVAIGSNVSYADIHEWEYPYLRPAIEQEAPKIRELIGDAMSQAVAEASA